MSDSLSIQNVEIPPDMADVRVDKALSDLLPEYTRSAIQGWIRKGLVTLGGETMKPKYRLSGGELVTIEIPPAETVEAIPQNIDLDIVHEDGHIIVLNKPSGLVVHPGAGNPDGTLMNGLLYHFPELSGLPRAGIVHRLDKDTTRLMVVARGETARQHLIDQLERREMRRQYLALVNGVPVSGETIDQPIGRHRQDRLKMAVTPTGKTAITHVRVLEKFRVHSLVLARLETGRTHQIRVHLGWRGYRVLGDRLYGCRGRIPGAASESLAQAIREFSRQALHAWKLALAHPESGTEMGWERPCPPDMQALHELLNEDASGA